MKSLTMMMEAAKAKTTNVLPKKATQEKVVSSQVTPAQKPNNTIGVTNHYTPIENIVTNVRNFFGSRLGIVVSQGEDNLSVKLSCSRFTSEEATRAILYQQLDYGFPSISGYINTQGLTGVKLVNVGREFIVYFYPQDIKTALSGTEADPCTCDCGTPCACKEMLDYNMDEAELCGIFESDDEELEEIGKKELVEILKEKDKIKAAKAFADKFKKLVTLPKNYYWTAVKDKKGHESVALRKEYEILMPFEGKETKKESLLNIYGEGEKAVWVWNWHQQEMLDKEDVKLIETVLNFLGAQETKTQCFFALGEVDQKYLKEKPKEEEKWLVKTEDGETVSEHDSEEEAKSAADKYNNEHEDSPATVEKA